MDRQAPTEPAPVRTVGRRRTWILIAIAVGVVVVSGDGFLIWQSHQGRLPLSAAAVAAMPVTSMTSPTATPTTTPTTKAGPANAGPTAGPTVGPTAVRTPVSPIAPAHPIVDGSWVTTIAARTGIPARAVMAYANTQLAIDATEPRCHITWTMLAGIGAVESSHGRSGGSTLMADGTTSRLILGPALDGTHGNVAIPATAAGIRLDGDVRWDHAVGPMQFIPSTWTHWGASADNVVPNPSDIDDAAFTAARYLCAAGGDLSTPQGWHAAVSAYNAPAVYEAHVTSWANTYAQDSQP